MTLFAPLGSRWPCSVTVLSWPCWFVGLILSDLALIRNSGWRSALTPFPPLNAYAEGVAKRVGFNVQTPQLCAHWCQSFLCSVTEPSTGANKTSSRSYDRRHSGHVIIFSGIQTLLKLTAAGHACVMCAETFSCSFDRKAPVRGWQRRSATKGTGEKRCHLRTGSAWSRTFLAESPETMTPNIHFQIFRFIFLFFFKL